jgi:DNA mismatch endonuclease (patch repair protein)
MALWRPEPTRPYKRREPSLTSAMMASVRNKDNRAETLLRKRLWALGGRYRRYHRGTVGRPDIVFVSAKVAVFVDGDFWHGRAILENGTEAMKKTIRTRRRDWWIQKLTGTINRDRFVTRELKKTGWAVVRVWESAVLRNVDPIAARVMRIVTKRLSKAGDVRSRK